MSNTDRINTGETVRISARITHASFWGNEVLNQPTGNLNTDNHSFLENKTEIDCPGY
jgi:hypothetical protein